MDKHAQRHRFAIIFLFLLTSTQGREYKVKRQEERRRFIAAFVKVGESMFSNSIN